MSESTKEHVVRATTISATNLKNAQSANKPDRANVPKTSGGGTAKDRKESESVRVSLTQNPSVKLTLTNKQAKRLEGNSRSNLPSILALLIHKGAQPKEYALHRKAAYEALKTKASPTREFFDSCCRDCIDVLKGTQGNLENCARPNIEFEGISENPADWAIRVLDGNKTNVGDVFRPSQFAGENEGRRDLARNFFRMTLVDLARAHSKDRKSEPVAIISSVVHATHLAADMQEAITELQSERLRLPFNELWIAHGHAKTGLEVKRIYAPAWQRSAGAIVHLNIATILRRIRDYVTDLEIIAAHGKQDIPDVFVSEHVATLFSSAWGIEGALSCETYSDVGTPIDNGYVRFSISEPPDPAWQRRLEQLFCSDPSASETRTWWKFELDDPEVHVSKDVITSSIGMRWIKTSKKLPDSLRGWERTRANGR